jgi:acyl-CoA thioesterase YciA
MQIKQKRRNIRSPASEVQMDAIDATNSPTLALRAVAMPMFANSHGDIFGGWLLSQMDLAGGTVATRRAKGRVVTVAVTAMTFHHPVYIGDEVSCYAEIVIDPAL